MQTSRADIECSDQTVWHSPFSFEPSLINAICFGPVLIVYVQEPPLKAKKLKYLAELEIYFLSEHLSIFIVCVCEKPDRSCDQAYAQYWNPRLSAKSYFLFIHFIHTIFQI